MKKEIERILSNGKQSEQLSDKYSNGWVIQKLTDRASRYEAAALRLKCGAPAPAWSYRTYDLCQSFPKK